MNMIFPIPEDFTSEALVKIDNGKYYYAKDTMTANGKANNWIELSADKIKQQEGGCVFLMVPTVQQSQS